MAIHAFSGVRESVLAGTWYPASGIVLQNQVDHFLANVPAQTIPGRLVGLLVPHAGHIYSGQVAAYAYKQLLSREVELVVLIGPSHFIWVGPVATTRQAYYETPLGKVPVDQEFVSALDAEYRLNWLQWEREHALEIQLPFLQRTLKNFALVPLLMGDQSLATARALGEILAQVVRSSGRQVILVASSDLSHYHPQAEAERMDRTLLHYVEASDIQSLAEACAEEKCQACGIGALLTVMVTAQGLGATAARILNYATSGDVSGDREAVVGYGAAAFYQPMT